MPTIFSTLYTDVCDRLGQDSTDTTLTTMVKRWINQRYQSLCAIHPWPFLQDHRKIVTLAEYTTGTIATDGTTAITGTSTVWTKAMTGRKFKSDAFEEVYRIAQRTGNTGIVIDSTFNGDDETTGTYSIFRDEYLLDYDIRDITKIRQYRSPVKLAKISLDDFRAWYPDNEPINNDPTTFCYYETRDVTRINVDNPDGTAFQRDEIVTDGTSGAYGRLKDFDSATAATYLYIEILYGTFGNNNQITGDDSGATCDVNETDGYTEGNIGNMLKILLYPAPYRQIILDCDVLIKPKDMSADDDEPLLPEFYRNTLIYGATADLAGYLNREEQVMRYESLYNMQYLQMVCDILPKTLNFPYIRTSLKRKKY